MRKKTKKTGKKTPKRGLYFHCHHRVLVEWCYDYEERFWFIKKHKDKAEQLTRIRLFKKVKGPLPKNVAEALQALDKTWRADDRAWRAYLKALQADGDSRGADQAHDRTYQAYYEAKQVLHEALWANMPAMEALHKQQCRNCPWNGKTIFPNAI